MLFRPHPYQSHSLQWLIERTILQSQQGAALFLDPGLGKTAITLAFINLLIRLGLARKVLIIAPLRVIYSVWPAECKKWNQFQNLKCSLVHGSEGKRLVALNKEADLYLINPEGVPWLANHYSTRPMPFDVLVVDESSKFKSWSSNRTKSLRKVLPQFKFRLILTGTPSPNSLEDLFAQIFIVDRGDSLGTSITEFRTRYFYRGGYGGYQWAANKGAQQSIEDRIKHACMRLASKDHLSLPDLMINDIWIDLPPSVARLYTKLEREMFVELDSHGELIANGAGAKYLMCKQLASGGLYDGDKNAVHVHESKIDALTDLVEELQGKPALLSFQFRHDLMRLQRRLPKLPSIDGTTKPKEADRLIGRWNAGELKHLAVQPQSLSHGINMQAGPGRDIIWLGLTDSLETYLQLNARIHRQGVTDTVRVHRILANRTVDQAVADRLDRKDRSQTALLDALGRYRDVLRQT